MCEDNAHELAVSVALPPKDDQPPLEGNRYTAQRGGTGSYEDSPCARSVRFDAFGIVGSWRQAAVQVRVVQGMLPGDDDYPGGQGRCQALEVGQQGDEAAKASPARHRYFLGARMLQMLWDCFFRSRLALFTAVYDVPL